MTNFLHIFERKKGRSHGCPSNNNPNNTEYHSGCSGHPLSGSQSDTNTDSDGTSSCNTRQPSISTINEAPIPLPALKHTRSNASTSSHTSMTSRSSRARHQDVRRIEVFDDGSHQHHLKNARRQEKLTRMIQTMMGPAKGSDAVSALPDIIKEANTEDPSAVHNLVRAVSPPEKLSLMSGLLSKVEAGEMELGLVNGASTGATKKQHAGRHSARSSADNEERHGNGSELKHVDTRQSLVEKYGRCQEIIGKGSYGVVRVCHKQDDVGRVQLFAVKEFKKRSIESPEVFEERLLSEFCIASSLKHHNIISTIDLMRSGSGLCYEIMEYCAGGDLYSLILSSGHGLTEHESDCFFKQILRGVNYMHSMGIAHCDLKPENVLLGPDGVCKISDFGNGECFRMAWEKCVHLSSGVYGSGPYIAPEEFKNKPFDPRAVDVWATGIIYMVMRTGSYLWRTAECDKDEDFYEYVHARKTEKGYAPIETLAPSKCVYVIYSILDPVPSRRLTGKQVLNSEWGRSIKVCRAGEPAKCTSPSEKEPVASRLCEREPVVSRQSEKEPVSVPSQAQLARNAAAPAVGESIY